VKPVGSSGLSKYLPGGARAPVRRDGGKGLTMGSFTRDELSKQQDVPRPRNAERRGEFATGILAPNKSQKRPRPWFGLRRLSPSHREVDPAPARPMSTVSGQIAKWLTLVVLGTLSLLSQQTTATAGKPTWQPDLPIEFQPYARALGDRLQTPGKERMTLTGTITQSGQSYPATLTYQLPNIIRIDESGAHARSMAFNGTATWTSSGSFSEQDLSEMESFLDDVAETTFYSLSRGSTLRVIARHSRIDNGKAPTYSGPWANIYELVGNPISQPAGTVRQKHYYFDAQTALPMLVRYRVKKADSSIVLTETSWTKWGKISGESVPGAVTRSEAGNSVLVFQVSGATFSSAANDNFFTQQ